MTTPADLQHTLRILLPETYEVFDRDVQPRSMGSAGLKYGPDGRVQWDRMWASFCDLAMAGGPPHRGRLLQPERGPDPDPQAADRLQAASAEIARGLRLVTGLCAETAAVPGWLQLYCTSAAMAGWLARSTNMENVAAAHRGLSLFLPTGASFRVEKEIKNVITSVSKGCHYWQSHMTPEKHQEIADLLATLDRNAPLLQPALDLSSSTAPLKNVIALAVARDFAVTLGSDAVLTPDTETCPDWLGLHCGSVPTAVWVMRALLAQNFIARREESTVFLPVNPTLDPGGERTRRAVLSVHELAIRSGVPASQ